jgi:N-methylhydantoinase A
VHSVGIDVGGTFTDFVAIDEDGVVAVFKHLTTPADPSEGVLEGLRLFAERSGLDLSSVTRIIHGTTLVANSIIERRGSKTALVTTTGFADVLEIGREARYDLYDLALERPEPLIPRPLRFEISERMLADGSELEPLDEDGAYALVAKLVALGIESVAICLLHSYANPDHEQQLARIFANDAANIDVTLSSDIAPEWREYERSCTAAANAFVRPLVRRYMAHLETGFDDMGAGQRLFVMLSQGGVTSAALATELAVQLIESGPAGGVMAAAFLGGRRGLLDLISFDMGGTTAKVSLIQGGFPLHVPEMEVARVARLKKGSGLPLKLPTIEITEIGTGGGSIGHPDSLGLLKVGPRSAGADPGPACYGKGVEATVTDADLHLGYLNPAYFLGGAMALYPERADAALAELGASLGIDTEQCARGIFDIVNHQMALAIRTNVVERGHDPRAFTLVAFGGAGPVHAYEVARILGIRRLLCPPAAGVASALGFLVSPFSVDLSRTLVGRMGSLKWTQVQSRYADMEAQARVLLRRAGADASSMTIRRRVDMRYAGQGYEVPVILPDGPLDASTEPALRVAFDKAYEQRYGGHLDDSPVETLHWRLTATIEREAFSISFPLESSEEAERGRRSVYYPEIADYAPSIAYDRYRLAPGTHGSGPALIEERESTIVIGPGATWEVDELANVIISLPERKPYEEERKS